jgi:hypothetical protein
MSDLTRLGICLDDEMNVVFVYGERMDRPPQFSRFLAQQCFQPLAHFTIECSPSVLWRCVKVIAVIVTRGITNNIQ